jgi:hypothetical protein
MSNLWSTLRGCHDYFDLESNIYVCWSANSLGIDLR